MVALDNNAIFGDAPTSYPKAPRLRVTITALAGTIALGAVILVLGAILLRGGAENGFRLGSQLAWRYTCLVFFAALVAGPLCRMAARLILSFQAPERLGCNLVWGFCASYGVYLLSVFLPNVIHLSAGASLMVVFGAGVALVMALTAAPLRSQGRALVNETVRSVLLGTATIYFWSCYSVMSLARISGPHRHDAFYEISISLMIVALLVRYADRWLCHRDAAQASPR